jgi:hypothetical protein
MQILGNHQALKSIIPFQGSPNKTQKWLSYREEEEVVAEVKVKGDKER